MSRVKKDVRSQVEKIADKKNIGKLNILLIQYFRLILFSVTALFLVVCFIYILKPKYDRIRNNIAESYETKLSEYQKLDNYLSNLTNYLSEYAQVADIDKNKINIMLPESSSYKEFYYLFETIAANHNIFLSSIEIESKEAKELKVIVGADKPEAGGVLASLGKINIDINIVGVSYAGLKELLKDFENSLRLMDIINIKFNAQNKEASLKIVAYFYIDRSAGEIIN